MLALVHVIKAATCLLVLLDVIGQIGEVGTEPGSDSLVLREKDLRSGGSGMNRFQLQDIGQKVVDRFVVRRE